MLQSLNIGLSSWIIQDGNYDDFSAGTRRRFALEFYSETPLTQLASLEEVMLVNREAERYDIRAKVAFTADEVWVLDCGVLLFREEKPPSVPIGTAFGGQVNVGIDPFFYMEYLKDVAGMPNLFYDF